MADLRELRRQKREKARRTGILSRVFLIAGAALILVFAVYQGINYPWRTQFMRWGIVERDENPADLPDPAPVKVMQVVKEREPSALDALPSEAGLLDSRPEVALLPLGVVKIPRIELSENVVEGSGDELYYAVGHIAGTALPGQAGNCVLAGHRNYIMMRPFRYLDMLEEGDSVYLEADGYRHSYEVFERFVVEPDEVWVAGLHEEEESMLTLVTCTPVMTAAQRLIVWCRLVSSEAVG